MIYSGYNKVILVKAMPRRLCERYKPNIKDLVRLAEKKIDKHIKNINLMIDTPDMFSIDVSIKKNTDSKKFTQNDIQSLLQEAKNIIQNNYFENIKR